MAINYADDQHILKTQAHSGPVSETSIEKRVRVTVSNRKAAPIEETTLKVLLEITGADIGNNERLGVDIVTVVDVGNLRDNQKNYNEIKSAMNFLIAKLTPIDSLSIITFSATSATRKFSLRKMTEDAKLEIEELVNDLLIKNESGSGISRKPGNAAIDGLQTALQMLNERTLTTTSRASAVMLVMCTCEPQSDTTDAIQIPMSNVPVFTFGLSPMYDEKVLHDIAKKSMGGMFAVADVQDTLKRNNQLTIAFSKCLDGLLTVVVQDLKLTITSINNSRIENVSASEYSKSKSKAVNSITISIGNVNYVEKRRVMVDLLLPAIHNENVTDVLAITYSYLEGQEGNPLYATVSRTKTTLEQEREEVAIEEARLRTVAMTKEALDMADCGQLDEAQDKIVEAQNMLEDVVDQPKPSLEMLKYELYEFLMLLQVKKIYESQGRAFALATQTFHDRQGFAQVISYNQQTPVERPTKPLAKDSIAAFPEDLLHRVEQVIKLLQTMQATLNTFR